MRFRLFRVKTHLGVVMGLVLSLVPTWSTQATPAVPMVAAGGSHSLLLRPDGTVWAWGYNSDGRLGDGTTTNSSTPVQVSGLTGVTAVEAGAAHSLALKADGTVWAWGSNYHGQLGDGTATDRSTPVRVSGLTGVTSIAAGGSHSLVVKADATVWAWGSNYHGQLGDGTATDRSTPVRVSGLTGVTSIAAGGSHSLAVKPDTTVWAWGLNFNGQLGDGTRTGRFTPVQVSGLTGVTSIAAGGSHSLAVKADGTVWAWGYNYYGQLGDGVTTTYRTTPVQVSGLTGAISIAAGDYHSMAVKPDTTVWTWGRNEYGELGDGTIINRTTPVQVSGLTGAISIAAGYQHSLALHFNGTAWAWGRNDYGQLGDGTTTNRSTPVTVSGGGPPPNQPPNTPTLVSPANGATFGSGAPQTFSITATDPDDDDYVGEIEVSSGGTLVSAFTTAPADSGSTASGSPPAPLPAGNYTWSAKAVDVKGSMSGSSSTRSFTVGANQFPGPPTLVSPVNGATFASGASQTFSITATDPDGDNYVGEIEVKSGGTVVSAFTTAPAASGSTASGSPPAPLPAGSYTWSAKAVDVKGGMSASSSTRSFTVGAPSTSNQSPNTPTLVSPANGATFASGAPQTFSITATDPNGDDYVGEIEVSSGGTLISAFTTASAASGSTASGSPPAPLPAGSYTWSAKAVDVRGSVSPSSSTRSFTVGANQPPNTPTLVSPVNGATFASGAPQNFSITATDPESDNYVGEIEVKSGGTVVSAFTTAPAASGSTASGSPPVPLPTGSYTWSAKAVDVKGNVSGTSSTRSFSVGDTAGFVYAQGNRLMLDGKPWRLIGVNLWDMDAIKVVASDLAGCYYTHPNLDQYFDQSFKRISEDMHATAVRTFGFMEFYTGAGADWGSTDKLLFYAQKYNVRVVPVFSSQWGGCGDPYKTSTWYSCASPCVPGYKQVGPYGETYRSYVIKAVQRYKDNPTIAFWQLMNEAKGGSELVDFSRDMVGAIRNEAGDSNHLINLGTKGIVDVPRTTYNQLLDGNSSSCPSTGSVGCNDLASSHDYSNSVPLNGIPMTSQVLHEFEEFNSSGTRLVRGGGINTPVDTWQRIAAGYNPATARWHIKFTVTGPVPASPFTVYIDDILLYTGATTSKFFTFEADTEGFQPANPAVAAVSQSTQYARTGRGSLRIDIQPTPDLATTGVIINAPPVPAISPSGGLAYNLEYYTYTAFNSPISSSVGLTIATNLHDTVIDKQKPFFLGEIGMVAEVPFSNPAFQLPNQYIRPSCLESARTTADRAVSFEKMMSFQLDDAHQSSGFLFWDWKDPSALSTGSDGLPRLDPNISCLSITPGDPAEAVIRKWADLTPNDPPLPVPAPLPSYTPSMFVLQAPPATAVHNTNVTIKVRMLHEGGNAYPGVSVAGSGGCSGSGVTDALGYVSFTCRVVNATGIYTITIQPDPNTCTNADCAGITKSYSITAT